MIILLSYQKLLKKKDKYQYCHYDDLDYSGIKDIENLFDDQNDNGYYKPILVKSSFHESYKYYEIRGDKDKKLSVEQDLNMIVPYLKELINNHKAIKNNSNKWKFQLNMHIKFVSSNDTGAIRTFYVWSENEEIRFGNWV